MSIDATVWGAGGVHIPGPPGPTGPVGPPNVLSIGAVTQGPAAATITGTSPAQVLNLTLPQGQAGPQGLPGPAGSSAPLGIGTVEGGSTASASITGTPPNQKLNLVLPKGDPGPQGDPGQSFSSLVYRTTDQTVAAWPANVNWQQVTEDLTGTWTVANASRLVVPAGVIRARLVAQVSVTSEAVEGSVEVEILKNGSPMFPQVAASKHRGLEGSTVNLVGVSSFVNTVVPGDYFELQVTVSGLTATAITSTYTWMNAQFT